MFVFQQKENSENFYFILCFSVIPLCYLLLVSLKTQTNTLNVNSEYNFCSNQFLYTIEFVFGKCHFAVMNVIGLKLVYKGSKGLRIFTKIIKLNFKNGFLMSESPDSEKNNSQPFRIYEKDFLHLEENKNNDDNRNIFNIAYECRPIWKIKINETKLFTTRFN